MSGLQPGNALETDDRGTDGRAIDLIAAGSGGTAEKFVAEVRVSGGAVARGLDHQRAESPSRRRKPFIWACAND